MEEKKPVMVEITVRTRRAEMPHVSTNLCPSSDACS
jgi:hypothetical protein